MWSRFETAGAALVLGLPGILTAGCSIQGSTPRADRPAAASSTTEAGSTGTASTTSATSASRSAKPTSAPPAPSAKATTSIGTPTTPGVGPASGPQLTLDGLSVRAPAGYEVRAEYSYVAYASLPDLSEVSIQSVPNAGKTTAPEAEWEWNKRDYPTQSEVRLVEPVVVDGVTMYHATGTLGPATSIDAYGANSTSYAVNIEFRLRVDATPAQRQAVIDSVLATVDLSS